MTDTVTIPGEQLQRMVNAIDMLIPTLGGLRDSGNRWLRKEIIESTDALRAELDATCQDSRQVQTAAEWVRCASHGAQHDVREIIADMQTAPVQEPVYAFRRKGMDDFCTCNKARFDELASKPHLFETAIFYTAQPRKAAVKLSENELLLVLKDAYESSSSQQVEAFLHGARLVEAAVFAKNGWTE